MTYEELYKKYEDFQKSIFEVRSPMMTHKPSDIRLVQQFFDNYLTKDELCERQYIGRFWAIIEIGSRLEPSYILYILIDNDTVMKITYNLGSIREFILFRGDVYLPDELRGRRYND